MRLSVFGLGYVGSVTAVGLVELGHEVVGVDVHPAKVEAMGRGEPPVLEPGLRDLLQRHLAGGRLQVTADAGWAVAASTCSLVAVGTPSFPNGDVELSAVTRCVEAIAESLAQREPRERHGIVIRSTVPPGTTASLLARAAELSGRQLGETLLGGMSPEFLREGTALADFFAPPLVVLGADDGASRELLGEIYAGLEAEVVAVSTREAELLKYVNNAFHALKIAFANEIGRLGAGLEIDGKRVMELLCRDRKLNLSTKYLQPGFAYGGSCLPKDLRALNRLAERRSIAVPLLAALAESNDEHLQAAVRRVLASGAHRVGVAGLTFKPGTDDFRESPALRLARLLCDAGLEVRLFDPHLDPSRLLGSNRRYLDVLLPDWERRLVASAHELAEASELVAVTQPDTVAERIFADSGRAVLALHGGEQRGAVSIAEPVET